MAATPLGSGAVAAETLTGILDGAFAATSQAANDTFGVYAL